MTQRQGQGLFRKRLPDFRRVRKKGVGRAWSQSQEDGSTLWVLYDPGVESAYFFCMTM